jgi:hypothetical protein
MATDTPASLRLLHEAVEREATALARKHGSRLRCTRGCHDCCVDGLTVFEVEADAIRAAFPELLTTGTPHAEGACALLDAEGACRIYAVRPYVCRTQGLPLRWLASDHEDQLVEYRDICPLNEPDGPELTELSEEECWTIGPREQQLAELQDQRGPSAGRVALRSLFEET